MSAIDSDDAEIREAIAAYAETWNRHDMSALAALFAPEADFVTVTGLWWKGRQQIESNHAYLHGQSPQDSAGATVPDAGLGVFATSKVHFDEVVVRLVAKDFAIAHGAWTMFGDARTTDQRCGMITFVLLRQGRQWLITAVQNTEIAHLVRPRVPSIPSESVLNSLRQNPRTI